MDMITFIKENCMNFNAIRKNIVDDAFILLKMWVGF